MPAVSLLRFRNHSKEPKEKGPCDNHESLIVSFFHGNGSCYYDDSSAAAATQMLNGSSTLSDSASSAQRTVQSSSSSDSSTCSNVEGDRGVGCCVDNYVDEKDSESSDQFTVTVVVC
jgi:hypothetical protein